jgi:peptidoglycan/LPS O-acetylase OafA/YrhL
MDESLQSSPEAAFKAYQSQKKFQALDGLRALSILAVVWHHTASPFMHGTATYVGTHGVTLFFAISGFLITSLLLRERDRRGQISFKDFYIRRALRIFPLYFGVLLTYAVLVALFERDSAAGRAFWHNLPYFLTYTSNLFVPLDGRVIFYFAWSLAVEEQFYLAWPCLLTWTSNPARASGLLGAVLLGCLALVVGGRMNANTLPLAIVGGALLSLMLHQRRSHLLLAGILQKPLFVLFLVGVSLVAFTSTLIPAYVVHGLLVAWVGVAVLAKPTGWVRLLESRPMVFVGTVSYGVYMLHMLAKNGAERVLRHLPALDTPLLLFALTLLLALALAKLSHTYFEQPFIRLKARFER